MLGDSQALVSVIVPIYNTERYLAQCLDSIISQTHENLEVLCINDGSTDSSPEIIKSYADIDPRVRFIDKENGGYGEGCNLGLSLAKGQWISIIEPDDWIDATMYEEMLAFAESFDAQIDIVKTPWTDIVDWDDPKKIHPATSIMKGRVKTSKQPFTIAEHTVLMELHPSIWSAIYRKSFLDKNQIRFIPYPGAGWADNPFLIETMVQARNIVYLDKAFYNYRCDLPGATLNHTSDAAITRPFDRWEDMMDVLERLGVTDERIIKAHYLRGFNYVFGAITDDGWDNPLVKEGAKRVFGRMKSDLALSIENLAPHRKSFYCDLMGIDDARISKLSWAKYLAKETYFTLKNEGPIRVLERVHRVFNPEEPATADVEADTDDSEVHEA